MILFLENLFMDIPAMSYFYALIALYTLNLQIRDFIKAIVILRNNLLWSIALSVTLFIVLLLAGDNFIAIF